MLNVNKVKVVDDMISSIIIDGISIKVVDDDISLDIIDCDSVGKIVGTTLMEINETTPIDKYLLVS